MPYEISLKSFLIKVLLIKESFPVLDLFSRGFWYGYEAVGIRVNYHSIVFSNENKGKV
jgi:hypothetical protein